MNKTNNHNHILINLKDKKYLFMIKNKIKFLALSN